MEVDSLALESSAIWAFDGWRLKCRDGEHPLRVTDGPEFCLLFQRVYYTLAIGYLDGWEAGLLLLRPARHVGEVSISDARSRTLNSSSQAGR